MLGDDITKGGSEPTKNEGATAVSLPGHRVSSGTFNFSVLTGVGGNQYVSLSKRQHAMNSNYIKPESRKTSGHYQRGPGPEERKIYITGSKSLCKFNFEF